MKTLLENTSATNCGKARHSFTMSFERYLMVLSKENANGNQETERKTEPKNSELNNHQSSSPNPEGNLPSSLPANFDCK
jgi:hypothetical protein